MITTIKKGRSFELQAVYYLKSLGYTIYGQNIMINRREVDIIAIYNNTTILVEVKYRKNFFPILSKKQQQNLLELGMLLSTVNPSLPLLWRIDFIVFFQNQFYHMENILLNYIE